MFFVNDVMGHIEIDSIQFINSKSDELGNLFLENQFDPASSFFLSKALNILNNNCISIK